ncbi:MAG: asparagine synthase [Bacillota bacterium]
MAVREGTIPAALGTVATGVGAVLAAKHVAPRIASGVVGFGAAHMVLGAIDLIHHKSHWKIKM